LLDKKNWLELLNLIL